METTENDYAQLGSKPEEIVGITATNGEGATLEVTEDGIKKQKSLADKYQLQDFDEKIFKIWEENYNINLQNNFFGNWLKYSNFINIQWKKYSKKPMVIVFAGPSVDKNIALLKPIRDKITIMCVDVIVFKLLEHDMKPDLVVNVDPLNIVRFWDGWDGQDSVFIAPVTTNPENLKAWKGKKHLYNPTDYMYKDKHEALKKLTKSTKDFGESANAGFVGATILQIIKELFPRPIQTIVIGSDFAFTGNKAYCNGFLDRRYPGDNRNEEKNKEFKKELNINVGGGLGVWTSRQLHLYCQIFTQIAKNYNIKMINCTEGGILSKMSVDIQSERLCDTIERIMGKSS